MIKLVDTTGPTGGWRVFMLRGAAHQVVFTDLVVDGNRSGLAAPHEQTHGIGIEPDSDADDIAITRCTLRGCVSDGIRMLGTPGAKVRRIRIDSCVFDDNGRTNVGIQRLVEQLLLTRCLLAPVVKGQAIDGEPSVFTDPEEDPTAQASPRDITIDGCIIDHTHRSNAISIGGIREADPLRRLEISNNLVIGGPVFLVNTAEVSVLNNLILVPAEPSGNRVPLQVTKGADSLVISGNILVNQSPQPSPLCRWSSPTSCRPTER